MKLKSCISRQVLTSIASQFEKSLANVDGGLSSHRTLADVSLPARSFVLKVPANLPLAGAAPLMCAGITVYSPLRHFGLDKPGMKIGVVGLGGLGHMVRWSFTQGVRRGLTMLEGLHARTCCKASGPD